MDNTHKFDYYASLKKALQPDIVALLTKIYEYKGRLALFEDATGEVKAQFSETAKMQDAEAAGIPVSAERLKKIVYGKTRPVNVNEQKLAGYVDALATVDEGYAYMPFSTNTVLQLHRSLYKYGADLSGGKFKTADTAATNGYIDDLCTAYNAISNGGEAEPLILIPTVISDFLCICPFDDGNLRLSRLLTALLLYKSGYTVGKYISLGKLVRQSEEAYFEALKQSAGGWYKNKNDNLPFIRYMLGIILKAYAMLLEETEILMRKGVSKPDRVASLIKNTSGKITKADILKQCADISEITVQRTLAALLKNGDIVKLCGGRYTAYIWNRESK